MAGKMERDLRPRHLLALYRFAADDDDFGSFGSDKQGHGVAHGASRTPAAVPGHHYAIKLQAGSLNIWNDEHGPTRVEESSLDDEPFKRRLVRFRLAHDSHIEPPCNFGESVRGARNSYLDYARLGRDGGAADDFLELAYRR